MADTGNARLSALEEVQARYRAEREKRLRADETDQYRELTGGIGDFDRDPFADPDLTRDPMIEDLEVSVIGGGLGGLMTAARLAERGRARFAGDIRSRGRAWRRSD